MRFCFVLFLFEADNSKKSRDCSAFSEYIIIIPAGCFAIQIYEKILRFITILKEILILIQKRQRRYRVINTSNAFIRFCLNDSTAFSLNTAEIKRS